jgi:hypothetical protein
MPRTWKDLKAAMPPRTEARISHNADQLDVVLSVQELLRTDPHLSTLRELIAAHGGELDLVARFPDRSYAIRLSEGE